MVWNPKTKAEAFSNNVIIIFATTTKIQTDQCVHVELFRELCRIMVIAKSHNTPHREMLDRSASIGLFLIYLVLWKTKIKHWRKYVQTIMCSNNYISRSDEMVSFEKNTFLRLC